MSNKKIEIKPAKKKGESKVEIVLGEELTIYTIEDIKNEILEAVNKYNEIVLTGSEIKNMDLSFVQLICSIQKTVEKSEKNLTLNINLSEENKVLFDNTDISKIIRK
ncbi:MAG: hypothetical protein C0597_09890 [Marinilabiliales bacterium]|nr:MAG: hypothetical protein C0597_09890 [Marinilabiliales bacterium]